MTALRQIPGAGAGLGRNTMRTAIVLRFAIILTAATTSYGEWCQWRGGPARDGVVSDPAPVFAEPSAITVEQVWKVPMPGEGVGNFSSAVVSGGKAYAYVSKLKEPGKKKSKDRVESFYCVKLSDGAIAWQKDYPGTGGGRGPCNTPCVEAGKVIGTVSGGTVYCLNADTGQELWKAPLGPSKTKLAEFKKAKIKLGGYNASATVADGKVIAAPYDLVALDAQTGNVAWRQEKIRCASGSPVVWRSGGKAYVIAGGGQAHLVDLADGSVKWSVRGSGNTTPAVSGDRMVILNAGNKKTKTKSQLVIYKLTPEKPEEVFKKEMKFVLSSPSIHGNRVYLCTGSGRLCLDAETGKRIWQGKGTVGDHYASFMIVGKTLISWTAPHRKPMGEGESKFGFYRVDDGKEIAVCDVTRLGECVFPAVAGNRLIFRGLESLWCYRVK